MVFHGKAVATGTPDEIAWQRTRGMVIMKINKKREAEMQRLAKLESSSRRKKTGGSRQTFLTMRMGLTRGCC